MQTDITELLLFLNSAYYFFDETDAVVCQSVCLPAN